MKITLRLTEIAMMGLGIYASSLLSFPWRLFLALFLILNIGMLGYQVTPKPGSISHNIFHYKGLAIRTSTIEVFKTQDIFILFGIILFSRTFFDRVFGYDLKSEKGFKYTHLGKIGKKH